MKMSIVWLHFIIALIINEAFFVNGAPSIESKSWPPMKIYDIWDFKNEKNNFIGSGTDNKSIPFEGSDQSNNSIQVDNYLNQTADITNYRQSKVLNFFPVPVDDECLSDDGRRSGICLNVYECRIQGGTARGQCALGFGVCCVFTATCDQEIGNNITYILSPSFPGFMPSNTTTCKLKIKMMSSDISQLRFDFHHFSLGQPNRSTGICDGDIFSVTGGLGGDMMLCGQNSGQHVYYEVGDIKSSRQAPAEASESEANLPGENPSMNQTDESSSSSPVPDVNRDIEILMNFTSRLFSPRLWEIRVTQIPFSQRAPAGCLQYFTGVQGIIQTFNFADNGRHLANQDYRACVRQETGMCSITYEPCDDQSFRIGPTTLNDALSSESGGGGGGAAVGGGSDTIAGTPGTTLGDPVAEGSEVLLNPSSDMTAVATNSDNQLQEAEASEPVGSIDPQAQPTDDTAASDVVQAEDPDAIEGSGGGDIPIVSTAPVRGGFDIFSFFRSTLFDFTRRRRAGRQFFSTCTDRITMPCIIEDFIGAGMGTLPGCEPVHCGNTFCNSGSSQCRIESTVTPFGIGVHFGDGAGKGSPEDNIGACLRYNQMPCL